MIVHMTNHLGWSESVAMADAVARINELSGRTIGAYVIGQAHASRRRGRCESAYVAANRQSPFRVVTGSAGFRIEVIRPTPRVPA